MFDEELLREQLDADYGRLLRLIQEYAETLDRRTKVEMTQLEGQVKVKRALLGVCEADVAPEARLLLTNHRTGPDIVCKEQPSGLHIAGSRMHTDIHRDLCLRTSACRLPQPRFFPGLWYHTNYARCFGTQTAMTAC